MGLCELRWRRSSLTGLIDEWWQLRDTEWQLWGALGWLSARLPGIALDCPLFSPPVPCAGSSPSGVEVLVGDDGVVVDVVVVLVVVVLVVVVVVVGVVVVVVVFVSLPELTLGVAGDEDPPAGTNIAPGGSTVSGAGLGVVSPGDMAANGVTGGGASVTGTETSSTLSSVLTDCCTVTRDVFLKVLQALPLNSCLVALCGSASGFPHAQRTRGTPRSSISTGVPVSSTD